MCTHYMYNPTHTNIFHGTGKQILSSFAYCIKFIQEISSLIGTCIFNLQIAVRQSNVSQH